VQLARTTNVWYKTSITVFFRKNKTFILSFNLIENQIGNSLGLG